MLAQVIHAGQLDETHWCRFVPEGFYTSAEGTLRLRQAKREPTPPWHPLGRCFIKVQKRKQSTRETEALQTKLPASSDDETQDRSYEFSLDKAARADAAADNDESSEESDEGEKDSKPAATSLWSASPRGSKTGSKNSKGSKPKCHDVSAESKPRVITTSKSQAVPKSGGTPRKRKMPALSLATFLRRARVEVSSEGPRRIRSKLAKLAYDDLQGKHLDMVEAACRETHVSYRIFGILVKFDPCEQSLGYPDFEPHKPDIHILKAHWNLEVTKLWFTFPDQ
ncbi:hypothetical protein PHMEG_00022785 [Phytophthora megakarya]|uniref:Uncharacterized protein n=1 Tax=Phytophthora megakarya TaxID=4795 RepID=A0A225VHV8_9STRA|nr:hypothetical protein PHMEG_00022785 [Phytophthora megakarya]